MEHSNKYFWWLLGRWYLTEQFCFEEALKASGFNMVITARMLEVLVKAGALAETRANRGKKGGTERTWFLVKMPPSVEELSLAA